VTRWITTEHQFYAGTLADYGAVRLYLRCIAIGCWLFLKKIIIKHKGVNWFNQRFIHWLTPVSITALLITLIMLFSFKGEVIVSNPLTILWIAIPLLIQTVFIFALGYFVLSRWFKLSYQDAAPVLLIGASNHFEVAIATAIILFGLSSGVALATVVGVLIEVPLMLILVALCKKTTGLFNSDLTQ